MNGTNIYNLLLIYLLSYCNYYIFTMIILWVLEFDCDYAGNLNWQDRHDVASG